MSRSRDSTPFPQRTPSLMARQYGGTGHGHRPERAIPVRAWILTVSGQDLEVDADAVAWTRRAVRVRFVDKHGHLDYASARAGAVTRR